MGIAQVTSKSTTARIAEDISRTPYLLSLTPLMTRCVSRVMRKSRAGQTPDDAERDEVSALFTSFKSRYDDLNITLYDFALCFEPGKAQQDLCQPGTKGNAQR